MFYLTHFRVGSDFASVEMQKTSRLRSPAIIDPTRTPEPTRLTVVLWMSYWDAGSHAFAVGTCSGRVTRRYRARCNWQPRLPVRSPVRRPVRRAVQLTDLDQAWKLTCAVQDSNPPGEEDHNPLTQNGTPVFEAYCLLGAFLPIA